MKILLTAATEAEIAPTTAWLQEQDALLQDRVRVLITGVGLMATTFSLTRALTAGRPGLVLGAGIAGAFNKDIHPGECVIVTSEQTGDLGAEDRESFLDIFDIGLAQKDAFPLKDGRFVNPLQNIPFPIQHLRKAAGLTVHTVSGHQPTIDARYARYRADVESMEGAALHYVCLQLGRPFLQLRAISNYVTPRDRASWKIREAIDALNAQLIAWLQQ